MEGLVEEGKEAIDSIEEGPVRDAALIGGAQKVEHYEIARYGTLKRWATELGMKIPRYGFTSGSEEQFLKVATSEQMEGVWDLRPTELTVEALADNAKTYVANYTKRFGTPPSPSCRALRGGCGRCCGSWGIR